MGNGEWDEDRNEDLSDSVTEVFSFDQLREAFANYTQEDQADLPTTFARIYTGEESVDHDVGEESPEAAEEPEAVEEPVLGSEDQTELSPRTILEAMLFVGDRENMPLAPERVSELMRNVSTEEIDVLVDDLNRRYVLRQTPYHIVREAGGYRMELRPEWEPLRSKFHGRVRETRLSQAAIDVLAIVAYKQPVSGEDVQKLRKASSATILMQLVRRGLLETVRVPGEKRSPLLYRTSDRFLKLFQIDSIADLPTAEEIDYR